MKPTLVCIIGETGSGKDTLVNRAIDQGIFDFRKVCSYTDRPIRDTETEGIEHYFVTTEEFNKLKEERANDILAYTHIKDDTQSNYQGYQYMALSDELEKSHIYIIDYKGLQFLKNKYGETINIVTVYIHAPYCTRRRRAKNTRSDFKKEFNKRVEAEAEQFKEFKKLKLYDYKIENRDGHMDKAASKLYDILRCEICFNFGCTNVPNIKPQKTNS